MIPLNSIPLFLPLSPCLPAGRRWGEGGASGSEEPLARRGEGEISHIFGWKFFL